MSDKVSRHPPPWFRQRLNYTFSILDFFYSLVFKVFLRAWLHVLQILFIQQRSMTIFDILLIDGSESE